MTHPARHQPRHIWRPEPLHGRSFDPGLEELTAYLGARGYAPHTIRHTTALHLLQAGVDLSVIALWLGHESPATTHAYVEADLAMKERALEKLPAPERLPIRYRPADDLLRFLEGL